MLVDSQVVPGTKMALGLIKYSFVPRSFVAKAHCSQQSQQRDLIKRQLCNESWWEITKCWWTAKEACNVNLKVALADNLLQSYIVVTRSKSQKQKSELCNVTETINRAELTVEERVAKELNLQKPLVRNPYTSQQCTPINNLTSTNGRVRTRGKRKLAAFCPKWAAHDLATRLSLLGGQYVS